jgi:hypothetical protein
VAGRVVIRPAPFERIGPNHIMEVCNDDDVLARLDRKLVVLAMMSPPRPGACLFSVLLEHRHFDPMVSRARNDELDFFMKGWEEDTIWGVVAIPPADKEKADAIALELGLRLVPGVPTLLSRGKVVAITTSRRGGPVRSDPNYKIEALFPYDRPNVFTLESHPDIPAERARALVGDEGARLKTLCAALEWRPKGFN